MLAPQILRYMPRKCTRLIEPFAGMAAMSIAAAREQRAGQYCVNDINRPLVGLLQTAINTPAALVEKYTRLWTAQFDYSQGHLQHYFHVRDRFNAGEQTAEHMLYLLARCVKGSPRYGRNGQFNQSPDKRRHGATPKNIAKNIHAVSALLKGKTAFTAVDYRQVLATAEPGDLVYMDPPYQGVSIARDTRYFSGVAFEDFADAVARLDHKGIDYVISYDGECGGKKYGKSLPQSLNCAKFLLHAGTSTQAILLGKRHTTYEALYVSKKLAGVVRSIPTQLTLMEQAL